MICSSTFNPYASTSGLISASRESGLPLMTATGSARPDCPAVVAVGSLDCPAIDRGEESVAAPLPEDGLLELQPATSAHNAPPNIAAPSKPTADPLTKR